MTRPSWVDRRLVGFDIETTGTDLDDARIVTAAVVEVGGGQPTVEHTWVIDPGVDIHPAAAAVHGYTTDRARAEGRPAGPAVAEIVATLELAVKAGLAVVAFNARFDLTILDREARRHDLVPLQDRGNLYVVDPLVVDKHLERYRKGSRKLDAMCVRWRANLDGAHAATHDAIAAARVAWVLAKKGRAVRDRHPGEEAALEAEWRAIRDDLPRLHDAQVGWAANQAVGLQEYFDGKGDAQYVEPAWPVVPHQDPVLA